MRPLELFSPETGADIGFFLFDIDDTLTTHGRLTADAYGALEALHNTHSTDRPIHTIAVTGRPAGWCDHIARMWPVSAVVGENGAFYFHYDRIPRKLQQRYVVEANERARRQLQLRQIGEHILREVPGCAWASDQTYRAADIAIDFCEDVAALPRDQVDKIHRLMIEAGLTAKVSSIHVNGWFGEYDKLSTTRLLFAERFGESLDDVKEQCVFVGDSPNDAPMFGYFPHSVGVANVAAFPTISAAPKYITQEESGAGFVALALALFAARSQD